MPTRNRCGQRNSAERFYYERNLEGLLRSNPHTRLGALAVPAHLTSMPPTLSAIFSPLAELGKPHVASVAFPGRPLMESACRC